MILLKQYHDLEQEDSNFHAKLNRMIRIFSIEISNRCFRFVSFHGSPVTYYAWFANLRHNIYLRFYPTVNEIIHKIEISRKFR